MNRHRKQISATGAILLAALFASAPRTADADEPAPFQPAPRQGVLLLQNGETIAGTITRTGDYYVVVVSNGEIRVRAVDVDFACDSLEDGYYRKRELIRLGTVQEHIRLAEWCVRHGLREFAEHELMVSEAAEPRHPMIGVLRRRLEIAAHPPAPPQQPGPTSEESGPDSDELDRMVRNLPRGSVETFTQAIQPLLVNNCTTSGCHGSRDGGKFQLMKTPSSRPASRRATQRNLYATLQWIDRENPEASPLLTTPIRAHGTAKAPIFTTGEAEQYARLVLWVQQVGGQTRGLPERAETPTPDPSQAMATPAARVMAENAVYKTEQPAPDADAAADDLSPKTDEAVIPASVEFPAPRQPAEGPRLKRGNPLPGFVPADPFDPEIFNRRHSPASPAAGTPATR